MSDKFQNKYRIASARLSHWDYGHQAAYFVTICTKNARCIQTDFAWQSRYHDHIIRNDTSFHNISRYIKNNPSQWQVDRFYDKTI